MKGWLVMGFLSALGAQSLQAQEASPSSSKTSELQQAREERRVLMQEFHAVVEASRDKSPEERKAAIESWQASHQEQLATVRQRESALLKASQNSRPVLTQEQIRERFDRPAPSGLKGQELELWQKNQALNQNRFTLMQSLQDKSPAERQAALEEWNNANAELLGEVEQLQDSMRQSRAGQSLPAIRPLKIPQDVSEQERERLTLRHQVRTLQRERAELLRSLSDATPEQRAAALEQWEQNSGSQLEAKRQQLQGKSHRTRAPGQPDTPDRNAP